MKNLNAQFVKFCMVLSLFGNFGADLSLAQEPVHVKPELQAYLDEQKEIESEVHCDRTGLSIQSAVFVKVRNYTGKARVGITLDMTEDFQKLGDNQLVLFSSNGFYNVVKTKGIGVCDDVSLKVIYRCGCETTSREYFKVYKIGNTINISCQ